MASVSSNIRFGILGAGRFGLIHARTLSGLPGCEVVALCNRNEEKLAAAQREFPSCRGYTDAAAFLRDGEIEAVCITTHWREHCETALSTLASRKHVLLEKPMAACAEECDRIVQAAEMADGIFMVGHVCRFDPRYALAKQAVDEGRIGRIISMHARRNLPVAPGDVRLDKISPLVGDGIHDADLMMWFLGDAPWRVYARNIMVDDFAFPDLGWAMLEFGTEAAGNQALGVIETVWRLPENTPTTIDAVMRVIGTTGQITIDCSQAGLSILDENGLKLPDTAYWPQLHGRHVGALANELSCFVDCIRTGRRPEVITPREAARAVSVMEAAEESAAAGQPVEIYE